MKKDIEKLIKEYEAFTDEHPQDKHAQLYTSEIMKLIEISRAVGGQNDIAYAIMNAYAVGFMTAYKRKK